MLTRHPEVVQPAPGQLFIGQSYDLYSEENHETWCTLYARILPRWRRWANHRFLDGIDRLALSPDKIPRIPDINRFMQPLTGFCAKAVSGYIPAFLFFDCLRRREFPTTITIRAPRQLDYLPEPDIFHDVAGHVPMHTDKAFADTLVRFGEFARTAALMSRGIRGEHERLLWLTSVIQALARFFWFTIEFGLMRENGNLRAYGSGLLSSYGELEHALVSNEVQRYPLQLEWVINQQFEIDHYQPLLFIIDSFEELFDRVGTLETWLREGRLSHVAPGEPFIKESDLRSFVHAVCD